MDKFRKKYLICAEMLDSLRIVPRLLVVGYIIFLYKIIDWYINLQPYFPEEVKPMLKDLAKNASDVSHLMVQAPTTTHAMLVSTVVGVGGAIFGLYTANGIKWADYKFKSWHKKDFNEDKDEPRSDD